MIGDSHRFLGEFNTARIHYGRALAVEARHVPALRGMALAFQSQGVPDDAERYLLDAQAADPENPELALQLGIHFQKYLQQPQKALTWYRKYYELGGADPVVREWISEVGGAPPPAGAR